MNGWNMVTFSVYKDKTNTSLLEFYVMCMPKKRKQEPFHLVLMMIVKIAVLKTLMCLHACAFTFSWKTNACVMWAALDTAANVCEISSCSLNEFRSHLSNSSLNVFEERKDISLDVLPTQKKKTEQRIPNFTKVTFHSLFDAEMCHIVEKKCCLCPWCMSWSCQWCWLWCPTCVCVRVCVWLIIHSRKKIVSAQHFVMPW